MTTKTPNKVKGNGCPLGCLDPDGEDCKASLIQPCPQGRYRTEPSGQFQPCGCLEREKCPSCQCCRNCIGCHCGEGE